MVKYQAGRKSLDFYRNYDGTTNLSDNQVFGKDFSKIKIGPKTLEDAIFTFSTNDTNNSFRKKDYVLSMIYDKDYEELAQISDYYFSISGIYNRLCRYLAYLYRYDWFVTPYMIAEDVDKNKLLAEFNKILRLLDNLGVKKLLGEIALKVVKYGRYYGYINYEKDSASIQELPREYCRSRFKKGSLPVVEMNMKFFDDKFRVAQQKVRMLEVFPDEIKKGYILYKKGKLKGITREEDGWLLLDPDLAFKFNINESDMPVMISVIPALIDLNEAQALDMKKMQQKLLKIIIQQLPIDKNGDLVFDTDEAVELHNNVVGMLARTIGVDVLTTFADVKVADMADKNTTTTVDDLSKVERAVYNEAGVSQNQFNSTGNLALEKSVMNDVASFYNLLLQFEGFLNNLIKPFIKNPKKIDYRVQILTTTIYDYKELSKLYKEQMQVGFSKMLPQIALGQSQSAVLATAYFENDVLDLVNLFIPPMMSSTMNVEAMRSITGKGNGEDSKGGRPTNQEAGKETSDKTLANKESMS